MKFSREEKIILLAIIAATIAGVLINVFFSYSKKIHVTNFSQRDEKININAAQADELQKLQGIGKVTAQRIIDYRQKTGGFKTAEEIMKIKGITNKKYEKIKNDITIGASSVNAVK